MNGIQRSFESWRNGRKPPVPPSLAEPVAEPVPLAPASPVFRAEIATESFDIATPCSRERTAESLDACSLLDVPLPPGNASLPETPAPPGRHAQGQDPLLDVPLLLGNVVPPEKPGPPGRNTQGQAPQGELPAAGLVGDRRLPQDEWEMQLDIVDQQQVELLSIQWKLVREQIGTLSREVAHAHQQHRDFRAESRRATLEVERHLRESEERLAEERKLRLATCEGLEQRMRKGLQELDEDLRAFQGVTAEEFTSLKLAHGADRQAQGAAQGAAHARFEQQLVDLRTQVDQESHARTALTEEADRLIRNHKTKLKGLVDEHAAATLLAHEKMHSSLHERLGNETAARHMLHEGLSSQLQTQSTTNDARLEKIEALFRDHHDEYAGRHRTLEASQQRTADDLARQLVENRAHMEARLAEERSTREEHDASVGEYLEFIDRFLEDLRGLWKRWPASLPGNRNQASVLPNLSHRTVG